MVQVPAKALTLEEFLKLPETKPASEFIDGQIIQKPMPQGKHSAIQGEFVPAINSILKPRRIARAFPELRCTFGDRFIVPDIVVFTWERIPRDESGEVSNTFSIAPDWAIEILSPNRPSVITADLYQATHIMYRNLSFGFLIVGAVLLFNLFRVQPFSLERLALFLAFVLLSYVAFLRSTSFKKWHSREVLYGFYFAAEKDRQD